MRPHKNQRLKPLAESKIHQKTVKTPFITKKFFQIVASNFVTGSEKELHEPYRSELCKKPAKCTHFNEHFVSYLLKITLAIKKQNHQQTPFRNQRTRTNFSHNEGHA